MWRETRAVNPYSQPVIWGVGGLFLVGCLFGFWRTRHTLRPLQRDQWVYVMLTEVLFGSMVALLGLLRQFRPDLRSSENFMDEGIIAAIMRSPHLPPNDVWFSGAPINYYYYTHFIAATVGKLIGQAPSVLLNIMLCILFGLVATNLFGLLGMLVVALLVLGLLKNSATLVLAGGLAVMAGILTVIHRHDRARAFVLLLGTVALALIALCEVVYLKDGLPDPYLRTLFPPRGTLAHAPGENESVSGDKPIPEGVSLGKKRGGPLLESGTVNPGRAGVGVSGGCALRPPLHI